MESQVIYFCSAKFVIQFWPFRSVAAPAINVYVLATLGALNRSIWMGDFYLQ